MPQITARRVQSDLTLDQLVAIVKQLKPDERELIRHAINQSPWSQRLDQLLHRVWDRVDIAPITEEEVDAEVELARTGLWAQGGY